MIKCSLSLTNEHGGDYDRVGRPWRISPSSRKITTDLCCVACVGCVAPRREQPDGGGGGHPAAVRGVEGGQTRRAFTAVFTFVTTPLLAEAKIIFLRYLLSQKF